MPGVHYGEKMKKDYLEIGKIVSTHALKGELRVQPWCDGADFIRQFKTLYFDKSGQKPVGLEGVRAHGNVVIMKLDCANTVEEAQKLRNKVLYMKRDDAKLPDGFYFISELKGCKVIDADDESIVYGELTDVFETGANDVWQVTKGRDYLIPAIPDVIVSVDVTAGLIRIRPLRGIFDCEVNGDAD